MKAAFSPSARVSLLVLLSFVTMYAGTANFQASAQMVLVPVAVTDHAGRTVSGLKPQNFTILDDQKPQPILSFASEDAPCSVGLVLDTSGSMKYALPVARQVASAFLHTANPADEYLLLTVSTEPDALSGFTRDTADLEKSIEATRPNGMTALIDTVFVGLKSMHKAAQPRRAMLVLSDGMDNHSRYTRSQLLRVAVEADVQIYTIILENGLTGGQAVGMPFRPAMIAKPGDQMRGFEGPTMLEQLADKTGGLHFRVHNEAEAKAAAMKVALAIRSEYVIGYRPPDNAVAGKWRRVRVKLNVPDTNVYARAGYYSR